MLNLADKIGILHEYLLILLITGQDVQARQEVINSDRVRGVTKTRDRL